MLPFPEDHRQIGLDRIRQAQWQAGVRQARREAFLAEGIEQCHGRHVERLLQRRRGIDRAAKALVEIARAIAVETLRCIDQQAGGMDQAVIERKAVQEWLEGGTGRALRAHHVEMAVAGGVAEAGSADVGPHLQTAGVGYDQRGGGLGWQARHPVCDARLQSALQVEIQRAVNLAGGGLCLAQAFGQQGTMQGRLQAA